MAAALVEDKDEPPEEMEKEPPEEKAAAAAAAMPCVWPPAVEARYERRQKLGEGMFGDVYKAWDRESKRLVAVKRLSGRTEGSFVKTGLHDLARESMSLAACRGHLSIVHLVATHADSSRGDGDCFLVTRYAGPVNLRRYMEIRSTERRPFQEREVRGAMRQLLAGVERVHEAGIMHMDITPENVVVDKARNGRMRYRVCGFGMSKPAAQTEEDDDCGLLAASNRYRAPELFMKSRDYDGRVDTWGLGCIMAELLAGRDGPLFGPGLDTDVFDDIMRVVGTKGVVHWPGLQRLPWATPDLVARLRVHGFGEYTGCLRQRFPKEVLSEAGFHVLSGLLEGNPERRLTAAAALGKPSFRRRPLGRCCFVP